MTTFSPQTALLIINAVPNHIFLPNKNVCRSKTSSKLPPSVQSPQLRKSNSSDSWKSRTTKCSEHSAPGPTAMDLKLTMRHCSTLSPWKETGTRTMFLSDFEQYLNLKIGFISFFVANSSFPPETVVDQLETAYRKVLVFYDYLAGRLRFNTEQGRLEVECNSSGAGLVIVSSELALAELGDLASSSPAFQQLETMWPEKCLFIIQVVSFKCGGFAIATCMNHVAFDGRSLKVFADNLMSLLVNDHLMVTPDNDRRPMSSTWRLSFPHLKGVNLDLAPKAPQSDLTTRVFRLSPEDVMKLKLNAMSDGSGARFSRFEVITAHIWRCKGLARNPGNDPDKKSAIHFAVDIRPRLHHPQLPPSFTGNAAMGTSWTTTCQVLEEGPFSQLVEMVSSAVAQMTEEHIRSIITSGEWITRIAYGDVVVSSWMSMGFKNVEYPWGTPKCTCPWVSSDCNDFIIIFPHEEKKNGTNILVTLPHDEMHKFEALFHDFI